MDKQDRLEYANLVVNVLSQHIQGMGYRGPSQHEDGLRFDEEPLRDGVNSGAIDMLSPTLRANFEDFLSDGLHFLSMEIRGGFLGKPRRRRPPIKRPRARLVRKRLDEELEA